METWFYSLNGQQAPVTQDMLVELLSSGQLPLDSLVWREGMQNWMPAMSVPEFAHVSGPGGSPSSPNIVNYGVARSAYLSRYQDYAGFWIRVGAYIIDWLVIGLPFFVVNRLIAFHAVTPGRPLSPGLAISTAMTVFSTVVNWLYFALLESSSRMASLGKQAWGLRVTDEGGQQISFGRATGRHFAKILSAIILLVGYMMVGWTPRSRVFTT